MVTRLPYFADTDGEIKTKMNAGAIPHRILPDTDKANP